MAKKISVTFECSDLDEVSPTDVRQALQEALSSFTSNKKNAKTYINDLYGGFLKPNQLQQKAELLTGKVKIVSVVLQNLTPQSIKIEDVVE